MPQYFMLMIVGGVVLLVGLVLLGWGWREEKRYYEAISTRSDAREFLAHDPPRPEAGALKMGGWIGLGLGLVLLLMGGGFWLWG